MVTRVRSDANVEFQPHVNVGVRKPIVDVFHEKHEPIRIPGQRLTLAQDGPTIEIEHTQGNTLKDIPARVDAVIRDFNGKVITRIEGVSVRESGALPERVREELERRGIKIPKDLHFYQSEHKAKTPYEQAMAAWEDHLKRSEAGIENMKAAIDKRKDDKGPQGKKRWRPIRQHIEGIVRGHWVKTALDYMFAPIATFREKTKPGQLWEMNQQLKQARSQLAKDKEHVEYLKGEKGKQSWNEQYEASQTAQGHRSTKRPSEPFSYDRKAE
ncbi:MAG: hypothetical protein V1672_03430 [Candidatus Diapherotrites archaeon]